MTKEFFEMPIFGGGLKKEMAKETERNIQSRKKKTKNFDMAEAK